MSVESASTSNEPRLGLFWFVATDHKPSRFTSLSRPFDEVAEIGGFRTLDEGHVKVWPRLQRRHQWLASYDYEYFPRGRVNWRQEDDRWLLLLDPKLDREPFIEHIVEAWNLPRDRLLVLTDSHYRSVARVGPPLADNEEIRI